MSSFFFGGKICDTIKEEKLSFGWGLAPLPIGFGAAALLVARRGMLMDFANLPLHRYSFPPTGSC